MNKQTELQYQKIWKTVQQIPKGNVATYGQIADLSGLPGRARMVGRALRFIPEKGFEGMGVPWHRVINAQGKLSLPENSEGFTKQRNLLQEEQVVVLGNKVKLSLFLWQPDLSELLFKLSF